MSFFVFIAAFNFTLMFFAIEDGFAQGVNQTSEVSVGPAFSSVRTLMEKKRFAEAKQALLQMKFSDTNLEALREWALGMVNLELNLADDALNNFNSSLKLNVSLDDYAYYGISEAQRLKGELLKSRATLEQLSKSKPSSELLYGVRRKLANVAILTRNWKEADKHLSNLLKTARSRPEYPQILYAMIGVELNRKSTWRACRWARKLYADFPSNQLVQSWGIDLQEAIYEGKKLSCFANIGEQRRRIHRLRLSGELEKARSEWQTLSSRMGERSSFQVDFLQAQYMVQDGYAEEALPLLLKHYKDESRSFSYLMLLGSAASRAGDFQLAVGAFYQAHQLSPRSKQGRMALFQAAFLSYQFQDYDGASRKFKEFLSRFPNSGLTLDVKWNLAWIHYLRGEYDLALTRFSELSTTSQKRRRRRSSFDLRRVRYWTAMSLLRLGRTNEARTEFFKLVGEGQENYYALAAVYRLRQLPQQGFTVDEPKLKDNPLLKDLQKGMQTAAEAQIKSEGLGDGVVQPSGGSVSESEENEESAEIQAGMSPEGVSEVEETENQAGIAETGAESAEDPEPPAKLAKHFEKSKDLFALGYEDWSRGELLTVEKKTRQLGQLRVLISAYINTGVYHRAAYLAQTLFQNERYRYGISGARSLWESTYPRAYAKWVEAEAKERGVPVEFVWAIMRAESVYKREALSPVGAVGLMQVMPNTAQQVARLTGLSFTPPMIYDPAVNIKLGTRYLERLLKMFSQSIPVAAAGYNAGPHRAESWIRSFGRLEMDEFIEHIPFVETRNYVKKVVTNFQMYKLVYSKEATTLLWLAQPLNVKSSDRSIVRETWDAL